MKGFSRTMLVVAVLAALLSTGGHCAAAGEEETIFGSSLHRTSRGMGYWYDKANGGLERLTGIPYDALACKNCHVGSCDACHKSEQKGKAAYSIVAARNQDLCLECHARESAVLKLDGSAGTKDVHFGAGMKCADCHTAREMHGDGTAYVSMSQQGAMDASCEGCHREPQESRAHTVHGGRLDCKACHVRHVLSCTNCHFGTLLEEGKRVAIPVSGWLMLMNRRGKVTAANLQTFVVPGRKTFLIFAPQFSHSTMKKGRDCPDCHDTDTVKKARSGRLRMTWLEDGAVRNLEGVVPVLEGVDYEFVYQDRREGKWVPLDDPARPMRQYVASGTPLTAEQLDKLATPQPGGGGGSK